jgi:hypothetical protein
MSDRRNDFQWDGKPGHYEVYYLTFTDPATGVGLWIRYTMVAPLPQTGDPATCSLWLCAMDPADPSRNGGVKSSLPVGLLSARREPFRLEVGEAWLDDGGMVGAIEHEGRRYAWDLHWRPRLPAYGHVHPVLRAARIANTILFLPHPDVEVSGTVTLAERPIEVSKARGGQAHLWGSKHASRWAWAHCNDFAGHEGAFLDGVSVFVPRFGREIGPSTPVVGRFLDEDFVATTPIAVMRAPSTFGLSSWHFESVAGKRKIVCEVDAPRQSLVGVTYDDPDGDLAYCYNSEASSMRVSVFDKAWPGRFPWMLRDTLESDGRAHFEYGQREPVPGIELLV